jgi:methanol metabolism-related c-type cytochrome
MKRAAIAFAMVAIVGFVPNFHAVGESGTAAGDKGKKESDAGQKGKKEKEGKWYTADGTPTYHIDSDGTVDWYTFSGFRRYHAECHTCHGPDGEGSTYAPALVQSLKTMSYPEFMLIVATGRTVNRSDRQSVMPAFGTDPNVACFLDDIYVYLKARADGVLPRGRPAKHADKPAAADAYEKSCFGER